MTVAVQFKASKPISREQVTVWRSRFVRILDGAGLNYDDWTNARQVGRFYPAFGRLLDRHCPCEAQFYRDGAEKLRAAAEVLIGQWTRQKVCTFCKTPIR